MERIDSLIADLPDDNAFNTQNQYDVGLESVNTALDFLAEYPQVRKRAGELKQEIKNNGLSPGTRDTVVRLLNALKLNLSEGGRRRTRRRQARRRRSRTVGYKGR
jgi:hypothetical protein